MKFNCGDLVTIIGAHPWEGQGGRIERFEPTRAAEDSWRVQMDGDAGQVCYVSTQHLRKK